MWQKWRVCLVAWLPARLLRAGRLREKSSTLFLLFVFFVCVSVKVKILFQCFQLAKTLMQVFHK